VSLILAPLRGVTIRCFRETFAAEIAEAGFTEAITPFISAMPGVDPLKDRELARPLSHLPLTPQFIGKDPACLRACLQRVKEAGYDTADLNCGCPFPMVRNKGRGSGILRTPEVLRRMVEVGCETMGPGRFSVKARLGVERPDELLALMPMLNEFPLRFLTVHARTARQMYEGACDPDALARICEVAKMPIVPNGDLPLPSPTSNLQPVLMIGRPFVRALGARPDAAALAMRYLEASRLELCGDRPVLGRMKELLAYWKELPDWSRAWRMIKLCRTLDELRQILDK